MSHYRCHNVVTNQQIDGGIYGHVVLKWVKVSKYLAKNHGFILSHLEKPLKQTVHPRRIYHGREDNECKGSEIESDYDSYDDNESCTSEEKKAILKEVNKKEEVEQNFVQKEVKGKEFVGNEDVLIFSRVRDEIGIKTGSWSKIYQVNTIEGLRSDTFSTV